jgi:hypothetical protein
MDVGRRGITATGIFMIELLRLFLRITALKQGPQDVPWDGISAKRIVFAYALVNIAIMKLNSDWVTVFLQLATDVALMAGFTYPMLLVSGSTARFRQTLLALLGSDALINFFALPALVSLNVEPSDVGFLAMLLMMVWHWAVIAHIYRHALERPFLFAVLVAFLYLMLASQVMEALFPSMAVTEPVSISDVMPMDPEVGI